VAYDDHEDEWGIGKGSFAIELISGDAKIIKTYKFLYDLIERCISPGYPGLDLCKRELLALSFIICPKY